MSSSKSVSLKVTCSRPQEHRPPSKDTCFSESEHHRSCSCSASSKSRLLDSIILSRIPWPAKAFDGHILVIKRLLLVDNSFGRAQYLMSPGPCRLVACLSRHPACPRTPTKFGASLFRSPYLLVIGGAPALLGEAYGVSAVPLGAMMLSFAVRLRNRRRVNIAVSDVMRRIRMFINQKVPTQNDRLDINETISEVIALTRSEVLKKLRVAADPAREGPAAHSRRSSPTATRDA